MLGYDIKKYVEESRSEERVYGALNATFISLISKKSNLDSFNDFSPISLCNLVYKIIAKIITKVIKKNI